MATVGTRWLTFLDTNDEHQWCETRFDPRVFIRFTDTMPCLAHVRDHAADLSIDVHFVFPGHQVALFAEPPAELIDTLKYIYCDNQQSIDAIIAQYGRRIAHNIFLAGDLEFEIGHLEVRLLHTLMRRAPEESHQRHAVASTAIQKLDNLRHIFKQNMFDQIGEQPTEWWLSITSFQRIIITRPLAVYCFFMCTCATFWVNCWDL